MTEKCPNLRLSRFVINYKGKRIYDQAFHKGVNIIHGDNSHGKSTISDLIYYSLGGELSKLTPEALRCESVCAEIYADDEPITLSRRISTQGRPPIEIFFGEFYEAEEATASRWKQFPIYRSDSLDSFSQVIFRSLGFPDVKGDGASNITMHQLLRVMYVDQITPPDDFFRLERFDSSLTRRTAYEYLLGVYDDQLYNNEIELRKLKQLFDAESSQAKQLRSALKDASILTEPKEVAARIEIANNKIADFRQKISEIKANSSATGDAGALERIEQIKKQEQENVDHLSNEISKIRLILGDTTFFIDELKSRIQSLDDSSAARDMLSEIPLAYCPQCLAPIAPAHDETHCRLCKEPKPTNLNNSISRIRQELLLQVKESEAYVNNTKETIGRLETEHKLHSATLRQTEEELTQILSHADTQRNIQLDLLFTEVGRQEATIADLSNQLRIAEILNSLTNRVSINQERIRQLEDEISNARILLRKRQAQASDAISRIAVEILKSDLPLEEHFQRAIRLEIDPDKNTFSLDGRNQFSASSKVILKNSAHFAILFASLVHDFFRYPRFIICDNIEDKGMTKERSQNFQRLIIKLSNDSKPDHQIIFTTSMLDPSLEGTSYCIGPSYCNGNKTLKLD
jgi:predicted  nucleic acid-binding Zn-ribbon protein